MSTDTYKIMAMGVIFAVGMVGGWLAARLDQTRRPELFFSFGSAMAAGVFLGAGLIHLLPDSLEAFRQVLPHLEYPIAPLLAALGCVGILFLEKVWLGRTDIDQVMEKVASGGSASPLALTVALSLHSILAGTALGAEETVVGSVGIFVAIIAHKGSAAFALAVGLHRGGYREWRLLRVIAFFSLMTPLGVAIGVLSNTLLEGAAERGFEAVFDGLAAGTFIYIACLDILVEEFSSAKRIWAKFLLVSAGLGLMGAIAIWM